MKKEFWKYEVGSRWDYSVRYLDAEFQTERLMLSPPHVVASYFEDLGRKEPNNRWLGGYSADEKPLFARDEPLIHLALARWGTDTDVLESIFKSTGRGTGLCLALFQNPHFFDGFQDFDLPPKTLTSVFHDATSDERRAIASNPSIYFDNLAKLISAFSASSDESDREKLFDLLIGLPTNDLVTDRAEYDNKKLRETLWSLGVILPAEGRVAYQLARLFRVMMSSKSDFYTRTVGLPDKAALLLAIRKWAALSKPPTSIFLDSPDEVAFHLTRAGLSKNCLTDKECFGSDLLSVRCAAYNQVKLNDESADFLVEQGVVQEAAEALFNANNWRNRQARNLLYETTEKCWEANRNNAMLNFDDFDSRWEKTEAVFREEHPEFFEDELVDEEGSLDIVEGDPTGQRFEDEVFYFLKQTRDAQKTTHSLVLAILVIMVGSIVARFF